MQAFFVGIFVEVSKINVHKRMNLTMFVICYPSVFPMLTLLVYCPIDLQLKVILYIAEYCNKYSNTFLSNEYNVAKENDLLLLPFYTTILRTDIRHTHTVRAFSFPRESFRFLF